MLLAPVPAQPILPASEQPSPTSLEALLQACKCPNNSWSNQTTDEHPLQSIKLCKLLSVPSTSAQPLTVECCLTVHQNLSWTAHVYGREIQKANSCLSSIPLHVDTTSLPKLIELLDRVSLCPGNPDARFLEMADARKGKFSSAAIDKAIPVKISDRMYSRTVRSNSCQIVVAVGSVRCSSCKSYRSQLRVSYSRWVKKSPTLKKHGNNRYLNTPQKQEKLKSLQTRATNAEKELKQLREKLQILQRGLVPLLIHTCMLTSKRSSKKTSNPFTTTFLKDRSNDYFGTNKHKQQVWLMLGR